VQKISLLTIPVNNVKIKNLTIQTLRRKMQIANFTKRR